MTENKDFIFDLTREDHDYRGVLFAEVDFNEIDMGCPFPQPKDYCAGIMAIIFIDENKDWHLVGRIKFPSGNKQVLRLFGGKDSNETKLLQQFYKAPMKNKVWTRNIDGTPEGIIKILRDLDMVESEKLTPL